MDNKLLALLGIGVAAYLLLKKTKDETVAIVSNNEPTSPPIDPISIPYEPPYMVQPPIVEMPIVEMPIIGCMDPNSITYNPLANSEPDVLDANGFPLCQYGDPYTEVPADVLGCVDPNSSTYNPLATLDDGSCFYPPATILGCTNPQAANFNPNANSDDGSCQLNPPPMPIVGCMDSSALNYDASADYDDGSCQYPPVQVIGCTDPLAQNYNPSATLGCGAPQSNTGNVLTNVNTGATYSRFDGT
jgi:hypothetical protein